MTIRPARLRLSRAKGFNLQEWLEEIWAESELQEHSRAVNGLPAINCARPNKWGNPYRIGPAIEEAGVRIPEITAEKAVALFRQRWTRAIEDYPSARAAIMDLRGKNLACWCALDAPCHADILLELANRPICEEATP